MNVLPKEVGTLVRGSRNWMWLLFATAALVGIVEAATLTNLLFLGYALLGEEPSGALGGLLGDRIHPGEVQRGLLVFLSCTFIVLAMLRFVIVLSHRYLSFKWGSTVSRKIQKRVMRRIVSSPLQLFDERQMGEIIHDLTNAPQGAISGIDCTASIMGSVFLIFSVAVMLAIISPWLLLIAVAIGIMWFITIVPPLQRRVQYHQQRRYDWMADGTKIATNSINGVREIRALGAEDRWLGEFSEKVDNWESARGRLILLGNLPTPALQAMLQAGFAAATIFAAFVLSTGSLLNQLPVLATFAYGLFRAYPIMGQMSAAWIGMHQSVPVLRAAEAWLDLEDDPLGDGTQQAADRIDMVRFDNLSFSYKSNEPVVIAADFRIQSGIVTALVGSSGAGKSTIVDLMLKFRKPSEGTLWVGDQNLNDVVRRSWLDRVSLVRQDVFLFTGTIRENLLEYKPGATDEELRSACHRGGALEFIDAMPEGMDTRVGERGLTLSGGQRQRIAIARALLRESNVLIFDEAMSALDGETEARILKSLLAESPNRTILLVSHRLATVRNADHIVVLDMGRVVEQGTHHELLEKRGKYWDLFATQLGQQSAALTDAANG